MASWFTPPRAGWSLLAALAAAPHAVLMLLPLLVSVTLILIPLRLIQPRRPLRSLPLHPGTAACGAVLITLILEGLSVLADYVSYVRLRGNAWGDFVGEQTFGVFAYLKVVSEAAPAASGAILSVWAVLLLSRRGRPVRDWVEWAGRVVGVFWLITALFWWATASGIVEDVAGKLGYPIESRGGSPMGTGGPFW